jgi:acyl carrier protein
MTGDGALPSAVAEVVALQLGKRSVQATDRLIEDLGAESADLVNLAAAIDDRFGIYIDEEALAAVGTVGDLEQLVTLMSKER